MTTSDDTNSLVKDADMGLTRVNRFMLRVNDGVPQEFLTSIGSYSVAVMQAFGVLNMPYPCDVEIWVPEILPDYGPYFYRVDHFSDGRGNDYGCPSIMNSRALISTGAN